MPREISLDKRFPHKLGPVDEAIKKLKGLFPKLAKKFGSKAGELKEPTWDANVATFSLEVMGINVNGTLTVSATDVRLVGKATNIPFPYSMASQGRIENELSKKIAEQLRELES
jgi:hypothetical protein